MLTRQSLSVLRVAAMISDFTDIGTCVSESDDLLQHDWTIRKAH